ncbi:hypothetical protein P7C70_g4592, partial [Phenoliferia sp. Uapishka_3]
MKSGVATANKSATPSDDLATLPSSNVPDRQLLNILMKDELFRFNGPNDIYMVVNALYASTKETALWTHADGQAVLAGVAEEGGPALARIGEILNSKLSTNAATHADKLSFQKGFLVLVHFLTARNIRNSPMTRQVPNSNLARQHPLLLRPFERKVVGTRTYGVPFTNCRREVAQGFREHPEPQRKRISELFCSCLLASCDAYVRVRISCFMVEGESRGCGESDTVVHRYLNKYPDAPVEYPSLHQLFDALQIAFNAYSTDILSNAPTFEDQIITQPLATRGVTLEVIQNILTNLDKIINRIKAKTFVPGPSRALSKLHAPSAAVVATLHRLFVAPGSLRREGARHDNDKEDIRNIKILPTHEELLCTIPPFVPANLPEAPHHLPAGSMARQVDILFRLLREDFLSPIRSAVSTLFQDLEDLSNSRPSSLGRLLQRGGGRYRPDDAKSASDLNIYTEVEFEKLGLSPFRHELVVHLGFRTPPGFAVGEGAIRKRLTSGSLVGLLSRSSTTFHEGFGHIYLGVVNGEPTSAPGDDREVVVLAMFDGAVYLQAIQELAARHTSEINVHDQMVFFEVPGFILDTLRPFLQSLQTLEPETIPFAKYLAAVPGPTAPSKIDPPLFSRRPGFKYNLSSLLRNNEQVESLFLDVLDADSIADTRDILKTFSKLDPSQADAMVDCLTREVAIVEGLGVELIRVLLHNNVGLILIIAYTNHALDTLLKSIINTGVTRDIVRGGSGSKDEQISPYSLNTLSRTQPFQHDPTLRRKVGKLVAARKEIEQEMKIITSVASLINEIHLEWHQIEDFLKKDYDDHHLALSSAPPELLDALERFTSNDWQIVRQPQRNFEEPWDASEVFRWWRDGTDHALMSRLRQEHEMELAAEENQVAELTNRFSSLEVQSGEDESDGEEPFEARLRQGFDFDSQSDSDSVGSDGSSLEDFFPEHSWIEPISDRSIDELLDHDDIWSFSRIERRRLCHHWSTQLVLARAPELDLLRQRLSEINLQIGEIENQGRLELIRNSKIVGCTTNSAANILELLKSAGPVCVIVEEAGENFLYPELEDSPQVSSYPKVRGMAEDVYFIDHTFPEERQASQHSSKSNKKEAQWVVDLVRHLLKQGYRANEIACLTPYLGQLSEIRRLLAAESIVVHLDARDLENLDDSDDDEPTEPEGSLAQTKTLNSQVILRTVDNFQGEEATIVILSLVRSDTAGVDEETGVVLLDRDNRASIGFLRSPNRTNVALSRAKHGLFIFGNASLFARSSPMWRSVVEELHSHDLVGPHLPAICDRHPEEIRAVDRPGVLSQLAPEGGCHQPCDFKLSCGHYCTQKCHPRDLKARFFSAATPQRFPALPTPQPSLVDSHAEALSNVATASAAARAPTVQLRLTALVGTRTIAVTDSFNAVIRAKAHAGLTSVVAVVESAVSSVGERAGMVRVSTCAARSVLAARSAASGLASILLAHARTLVTCHALVSRATSLVKNPFPAVTHARRFAVKSASNSSAPLAIPSRTNLSTSFSLRQSPTLTATRQIPPSASLPSNVATLLRSKQWMFYRKDDAGNWIGLAHPDSADDVPPTCPLCRASISHRFTQRYGRALKHAELNSQERNAMVRGTAALAALRSKVARLDLEGINVKLEKFDKRLHSKQSDSKRATEYQQAVLHNKNSTVVSPAVFRDLRTHAASPTLHNWWKCTVGPILRLYEQAVQLVRSSPHVVAYEGAITGLVGDELARLAESGERVRDPEKSAMEFARKSVGASPPKADERCAVEAIWITLDLRLDLVDATRSLITGLDGRKDSDETAGIQLNTEILQRFAWFILKTCRKDALTLVDTTIKSHAERQALQSHLRLLRIKLELSRLSTHFDLDNHKISRDEAACAAEMSMSKALDAFDRGVATLRDLRTGNSTAHTNAETWISTNITTSRERIIEQWIDVVRFAKSATFYAPVTMQERQEVIKSMDFAASGHWYRCPEGHPFTIGECGGAMEVATCPECGSQIGGRSHNLLSNNSKDDTMEGLALAGGARRNTFPWG